MIRAEIEALMSAEQLAWWREWETRPVGAGGGYEPEPLGQLELFR